MSRVLISQTLFSSGLVMMLKWAQLKVLQSSSASNQISETVSSSAAHCRTDRRLHQVPHNAAAFILDVFNYSKTHGNSRFEE